LLENLAFSSFSPSAQKQEAWWVYAFFFQKESLAKKKFFQGGSVSTYFIS